MASYYVIKSKEVLQKLINNAKGESKNFKQNT